MFYVCEYLDDTTVWLLECLYEWSCLFTVHLHASSFSSSCSCDSLVSATKDIGDVWFQTYTYLMRQCLYLWRQQGVKLVTMNLASISSNLLYASLACFRHRIALFSQPLQRNTHIHTYKERWDMDHYICILFAQLNTFSLWLEAALLSLIWYFATTLFEYCSC